MGKSKKSEQPATEKKAAPKNGKAKTSDKKELKVDSEGTIHSRDGESIPCAKDESQ